MKDTTTHKLLGMAGFGLATAAAAATGAIWKPDRWFRGLKKPWFQPPNRVFAPIWAGLYTLMAVSGYRVWRAPSSPQRTTALTLWGTQLGLNAAWSWLFFGRHDPKAALLDVGLLQTAVTGYARAAEQVDPASRWLMAPYKAWIGFASMLNAEIVRQNAA